MGSPQHQSKRWGITTWKEEHPAFNEEKMDFLKTVQHKAPETGKQHWHSFVVLKTRSKMKTLKNLLNDNEAHCLVLKGNDTTYLEDGHDTIQGPFEYGTLPDVKQSSNRAMKRFKADLESDIPMPQVAQNNFGCFMRYAKMASLYRSMITASYKAKYPKDSFKTSIDDWSKQYHLWGRANTGKTQFALAQFEKPLFVRHQDQLTQFHYGGFDGIVFDEFSIRHWPIQSVIALVNNKDPNDVHIRYTTAHIPAGTRMIFCSNEQHIFFDPEKPPPIECVESLQDKVYFIEVTEKLF